jgi:hypothetical protein
MIKYAVCLCLSCGITVSAQAGEQALAPKRSVEAIRTNIKKILAKDDQDADENTKALRRLQAYRYLAELPYEDLTLDDNYNKMCLAGVKLCEKIGKLDHRPMNPGLPDDEFKLAFKGTSQSNLGQGYRSLVQAVDGWMDDSDDSNIDRLGHRRWCLNPTMAKTGFGRAGVFVAMFSFDRNRIKVPDHDMVCYPARGYMPIGFFGSKHAWSVTLNARKYKAPAKDYAPKIYRVDESGAKIGEPLTLDYKNVDPLPFGVPGCIIFRPANFKLKAGDRYVVELEGIRPQASTKVVSLRYSVEFVAGP